MSAEARVLTPAQPSQWIANPRWDLICLTLSAGLVALPPLVHSLGKTTAGGMDLLITLLIGGPHMYATFLKTVFEPRFRKMHPALTWAPVVVVPIGVVLGAVYAFPWLPGLVHRLSLPRQGRCRAPVATSPGFLGHPDVALQLRDVPPRRGHVPHR